VRGIFVEALPPSKYINTINKSTTKTIFESFCSVYEEYASCDNRGGKHLWTMLGCLMKNDREVALCMNGDFHIIRSVEERMNKVQGVCYEGFTHFNWFIEDGLSMSQLNRFMLSEY